MSEFLKQQKEQIVQQIDQTDLTLRRVQENGKQLEAQLNGLVGALQAITQLIDYSENLGKSSEETKKS